MPYHIAMVEKPIFFLGEAKYEGSAPAYFDPVDFPYTKLLEEHWGTIHDEMLDSPMGLRSPIYNPNQDKGADKWKMVIFYNYLWKQKDNCRKYPKTQELLQQIDGLTYAAFNLLEPRSEIKGHYGDTNTTMRCHVGIDIPAPLPACGLEVNGEQRGWENGKALVFNDAHYHRAWNHTDSKRYVFVVDVIRPEYKSQKLWICAGVLAALSLKTIGEIFPAAHLIPKPIIKLLHVIIRLGWWLKIKWF